MRTPDLILLDVILPDLLGTEVCRILKSEAATQETPIVMLSGRVAEADRIQGFELGADDYVASVMSVLVSPSISRPSGATRRG